MTSWRKKYQMWQLKRSNWQRMHIKSPWGHCLSTSYSIECLESITFVKRKKTSSKKTPWSMLLNYSTLTSFSENCTCPKRKRPMMIKTWSKTNYLRQMKGTRMPSLTMSLRILKFKWCKQEIWLTKRRPSRTSRISFLPAIIPNLIHRYRCQGKTTTSSFRNPLDQEPLRSLNRLMKKTSILSLL